MVLHETYRATDGTWLLPEEVVREGGKVVRASDKSPVEVGRSEKMSKSKKNVVDPDQIIRDYGADTARWFMLSDSPPERDLEWTETGIEGIWRYVNRLWRLVSEPALPLPPVGTVVPGGLAPALLALRRQVHKTIATVTDDLDKFRFNRAVARIRELTNAIEAIPATRIEAGAVVREGIEAATLLIGPMMPHLAEEMWRELGHATLLADERWPTADPRYATDETVTVAVQVNGKLRGTIELPRDAAAGEIEEAALALPQVARLLDGRAPKKIVVVPNRIVSVVA
jgi:leucyl-tRNA synthetase